MKLQRRVHGEDGTSLLLAIAFIAFLGIFTVAILGVTYTDFKTTTVARTRADGLYASDGGADFALERFRTLPWTTCPGTSTPLTPGPGALNNSTSVTVNYACSSTTVGASPAACGTTILSGSYCAVATGSAGITVGGTIPTTLNPPLLLNFHTNVWSAGTTAIMAAGTTTDSNKTVVNGNLRINTGGACSANDTTDPRVVMPPNTCTVGAAPAFTSGSAPVVVPPTAAAPSPVSDGNDCIMVYPGKYGVGGYANGATFSADGHTGYYMASGTYYFNDTNDVTMQGWIQGGAPGATTPLLASSFSSRCDPSWANDNNARTLNPSYTYTGSGITIIVGGTAPLKFGSTNDTKIELFPRVTTSGPDNATTDNVTIWGKETGSTSNYTNLDAGTNIYTTTGSGTIASDVVVHGFTYAPDSTAQIAPMANLDAGGSAQFRGGIYAKKIMINGNNNTGSVAIAGIAAVPGVPGPRTVTFTVTTALPNSYASTVLTVLAEYPTTSGGQPKILSWRKT
jgi:hypothetical protein